MLRMKVSPLFWDENVFDCPANKIPGFVTVDFSNYNQLQIHWHSPFILYNVGKTKITCRRGSAREKGRV